MKSKDLLYVYETIPYQQKNIYPSDLNTNTILQVDDAMKKYGFENKVKKLKTGHFAIDMKREDGSRIATLKNPIYPTNSQAGRKIAIDKYKTENFLSKAGLRTTKSKVYTSDEMDRARNEAYSSGAEGVVIKPLDMSLGKGVFVNVAEDDFDFYWKECTAVMAKTSRETYHIMVQEFMEGFEVRATIIEGNLISVVARVPAFVKGDGAKSIDVLIDEKNESRKECGYLSKHQIKKSDSVKTFLKNSGLTLDSIPEKDEYILLISVSNTSLGGEVIEITELVSKEIKELALNALAALPGMYCGGIDIMVRNFDDTEPGVIEINPFPVLSLTMFPTYGQPAKPADYFVNAFYTKDALINGYQSKADSDGVDKYVRNYMRYHDRQQRMYLNQFATNNQQ
ncbi:ATP-grasp domain-containing protein [Salinicoccus cyprini]|uniref:ATP-grasp domain-containing protein n=1 Tax=Salinicoccus cyprini TaxID=2493691 RepID=A0A558AX84_9STAP|nr:ATP-grasp domain-containing protein [Salinicoccus cyprini]TVT28873.1 ATP-grasp domain-containing protein [Salinicoccus cyprini]